VQKLRILVQRCHICVCIFYSVQVCDSYLEMFRSLTFYSGHTVQVYYNDDDDDDDDLSKYRA